MQTTGYRLKRWRAIRHQTQPVLILDDFYELNTGDAAFMLYEGHKAQIKSDQLNDTVDIYRVTETRLQTFTGGGPEGVGEKVANAPIIKQD